jgi:hypothetical protein
MEYKVDFLLGAIGLLFYYYCGRVIEANWGVLRFNCYYFAGILLMDLAGMLICLLGNARYPATADYLNLSLFLAFACLYPDQEILLFFILPIKVRYIGYLDAAYLIYLLLIGTWPMRICLVASMLPFILFFGKDAYQMVRYDIRRLKNQRRF